MRLLQTMYGTTSPMILNRLDRNLNSQSQQPLAVELETEYRVEPSVSIKGTLTRSVGRVKQHLDAIHPEYVPETTTKKSLDTILKCVQWNAASGWRAAWTIT